MYKPHPATVFKRLLANPKASQKTRLVALEQLTAVPISLLLKLLADPTTPQRLLAKLALRYDVELSIKVFPG